jgi:hypothetical protein
MNDYVLVVSTVKPSPWITEPPGNNQNSSQAHTRTLKKLSTRLPKLHGEFILNHETGFLDQAKCAASFCSSVVRASKSPLENPKVPTKTSLEPSERVKQLVLECSAIDQMARSAVSRVNLGDIHSLSPDSGHAGLPDTANLFQSFTFHQTTATSSMSKHIRKSSDPHLVNGTDVISAFNRSYPSPSSGASHQAQNISARIRQVGEAPGDELVTSPQTKPSDERRRLHKSSSRPDVLAANAPIKKRSGFFNWNNRKDENPQV